MAKTGRTNVPVRGKLGEWVYTQGKYGNIVRKAARPGSRKGDIALKMQYSRTKFINRIAGEMNRHFSIYHNRLKSKDFYTRLQQCFRKEPEDNRFLLLLQLKDLELNNSYPLSKLGRFKVTVTGLKKNIKVFMDVEHHPKGGRYQADGYYNELMLLTWDKTDTPATIHQQFSEWLSIDGGKPDFEFLFPRPAGTTHWLLCLRQCLGVKNKEVPSLKGEGMQVVAVGTFDKKEQAMWDKLIAAAEERKQQQSLLKPLPEVVRVKAKRMK